MSAVWKRCVLLASNAWTKSSAFPSAKRMGVCCFFYAKRVEAVNSFIGFKDFGVFFLFALLFLVLTEKQSLCLCNACKQCKHANPQPNQQKPSARISPPHGFSKQKKYSQKTNKLHFYCITFSFFKKEKKDFEKLEERREKCHEGQISRPGAALLNVCQEKILGSAFPQRGLRGACLLCVVQSCSGAEEKRLVFFLKQRWNLAHWDKIKDAFVLLNHCMICSNSGWRCSI